MDASKNPFMLALSLMATVALAVCGVAMLDTSDAAYTETTDVYEIDLAPGFSWTWTPTYPSDLDVTTTVEKYEEGVVAEMIGQSVKVTVADGTVSGTYDVLIKAYTDTGGLEQTVYKIIRVTVVSGLDVSGSVNNIILGASVDFTPGASSGMTEIITWSTSDDLASMGLTLENGKVTGTPASAGTYSFTLTASSAGETKDLEISFIVFQEIVSGSDETITSYGTQVSSSAVQQTVSETDTTGDLNVVWTSTQLPEGFVLDASTGSISGSSSVFQSTEVTVTGTDSASGQSVSHVVTVRSEPAFSVSGDSLVTVYSGCSPREVQLTFTEGTSAVTWSVTEAAGVSIDQNGKVTVTGDASAGNITVTAQTAYGQSVTHQIQIAVESEFSIVGPSTLNAIAGTPNTGSYSTSVEGVTWSVECDQPGAAVSIDPESGIMTLSSASPQSEFTVTVTATSVTGQTATFQVTCTVLSPLSFTNEPSTGVIVFEI